MHFGSHRRPTDGYGIDIVWPPEHQHDRDSNVDIVFVHGLGGKRHRTWMKNDVFWPVDLLAKDFPQARIMTWGYDSRVLTFFGPVGQGSIHAHANELNNDLAQERRDEHQVFRPLIFFAHSLGGLVVKNALFNSYLERVSDSHNKDRSMAIERSTVAVIFAGTPHRGSDQTKWASIATKLAKATFKDHSTKMLDALKRGSETLETLQDWFKRIQYNFHVFTFVEEIPVHKIGAIVEADSAAIHCEHEKRRMIHGNHMDMVRFGEKNNEYKKVMDAFRQIHQFNIDNRTSRDIGQPPRRLETIRQKSLPAIEETKPANKSMNRLLEYHQRPRIEGRPNTLSVENPFQHMRRHSNERTRSTGVLEYASPHLMHHASSTTLATMSSGQSRQSHHSAHSVGSDEGQRSISGDERNKYLNLVEQGSRLVARHDRNFAANLLNAKSFFHKAREHLSHNSPSSTSDSASLEYQLMNVEFNMQFNRDMTPQEKLSHLITAEQHGWDAANNARQIPNGEGAGLLAQVDLYMAIIKGRRAEIHERLGVPADATRKQKDDALSGIYIAMEKIRDLAPTNIQQSEDFANQWTERLKPPQVQEQNPNQDTIIENPTITMPELASSGANASTSLTSSFAEMSTSDYAPTPPPPYDETYRPYRPS